MTRLDGERLLQWLEVKSLDLLAVAVILAVGVWLSRRLSAALERDVVVGFHVTRMRPSSSATASASFMRSWTANAACWFVNFCATNSSAMYSVP